MNMEHWWNDNGQGKTSPVPLCPLQAPHGCPGIKPGFCTAKRVTVLFTLTFEIAFSGGGGHFFPKKL
jgi:hypothetical protein